MTLPTTISAVTYAGNGVTTQFDWAFLIPSEALAVYRTEDNVAVLVDPSAYSVSGLDDPNGGTVSFAQAPALGQTITIKRNVALTQDMALVTGSAFYAEVVEGAFDRATMQIQQLAEEMGRAVQVPIGSGVDPADYLDAAAQSAAQSAASASSAAESVIAADAAQSGSETARDEAVAAKEAVDAAMASLGPATTTTPGISRRATPEEIEEKTAIDVTVSPADLAGLEGAPVGSLLFQSVRETHVQPGYILGNGAPVTEAYPELRALYIADGYPYGQDEYGNPLTPNYPGYTIRGWLPGQIVDSGRVWGSRQEDALQNITGSAASATSNGGLYGLARPDGLGLAGAFYPISFGMTKGVAVEGTGGNTSALGFDASRVVRTADETRGKNITTVVWIKAYAANTNPGSIDLAQLTADIQQAAAEIITVKADVAGLKNSRWRGEPINITGLSSVAFTGIPSDATKVEIKLTNITRSSDGLWNLLLGTADSYETTGYAGTSTIFPSAATAMSTSFILPGTGATDTFQGTLYLNRGWTTNQWFLSGLIGLSNKGMMMGVSGSKTLLLGPLARIQIAPAAGVFNAGGVYFSWEK